jgi:putative transposase
VDQAQQIHQTNNFIEMSDYRRAYQDGGCYFFTVVTHGRRKLLTEPAIYQRLRAAFLHVNASKPLHVDAIVVLPDHLHCVWRLPQDDRDLSSRWRLIKHFVSRGVATDISERQEKLVWQRRFWEHLIRDERDWQRHIDYIFYNPVKHGYVTRPADWRWSSFPNAVSRGWYDTDWGANEPQSIPGMDRECCSAERWIRSA